MTGFTQLYLEKIKTPPKRVDVKDDGNPSPLYLRLSPTGHKAWVYIFRPNKGGGAKQKIHLGAVDLSRRPPAQAPVIGHPLTLQEARAVAKRLSDDRARGVDIKRRRETAANSFDACALKFADRHASKNRSWRETFDMLGICTAGTNQLALKKGGLAERWAGRDVATITKHDLIDVIEEARVRGIPGTDARKKGVLESRARKMHVALSSFFGRLDKLDVNPMATVRPPDLPKKRKRVLSASEIKTFWEAAAVLPSAFRDCLRILLVTGARLNEIAKLRWSEFEIRKDGAVLNLPGHRIKNEEDFRLPLSPLARSIIEAQPRRGPYVFSTTKGERPISGWSKTKKALDAAMGDTPHWIIHDLRRTVSTQMNENGLAQPWIVEVILNHVGDHKAGAAGFYNWAEYQQQKRAALEAWALHLAMLI